MSTRDFFEGVGYTLKTARFSVLMVLVGTALLLAGPGQDLIRDVAEAPYWQRQVFFGPVLIWAASAWYCARVILRFRFPDTPELTDFRKWLNRNVPRSLGVLAFLTVGIASWVAADTAGATRPHLIAMAGIAVVYAGVFFLLVWKRRPIVIWLRERLTRLGGVLARVAGATLELKEADEPYLDKPADLQGNTIWAVAIFVTLSVAIVLAAVIDPNWLARRLGTAAVVYFVWAATLIPLGSLLVYASNRYGFPGLTLVLVFAFICSGFNDNHDVRTVRSGKQLAERPLVAQVVRAWLRKHGGTAQNPAPMIIVATAGGGSRAAYWTATVLGALQDKWPAFGDYLFAISGVSGGSVGATAFKALHQRYKTLKGAPLCRLDGDRTGVPGFASCGQALLDGDFLAPTLAAMLYPDLIQRIIPAPVFRDRAHALERSWELAWRDVVERGKQPESPHGFLTLWPGQNRTGEGSWPALLLNGTWVESGQRFVTSNLRVERQSGKKIERTASCRGVKEIDRKGDLRCTENGAFVRVHDLLHRVRSDVPVWTAANNSARFPFVEPAGTLRKWSDRTKTYGDVVGHVVDGGYFENYGAVTALELVEEVVRVLNQERAMDRVKIVVIQISSDPTLNMDWCTGADDKTPLRYAPEIRAPLRGFLKTREARGLVAFGALCDRIARLRTDPGTSETAAAKTRREAGRNDRFIHFRMCRERNGRSTDGREGSHAEASPPLSWALSKQAQDRIRSYLPTGLLSQADRKTLDSNAKNRKPNCNKTEFERLSVAIPNLGIKPTSN